MFTNWTMIFDFGENKYMVPQHNCDHKLKIWLNSVEAKENKKKILGRSINPG